ncbi:MAG: ABC transporter substrate-binding protein [Chloroflexota bacterium]
MQRKQLTFVPLWWFVLLLLVGVSCSQEEGDGEDLGAAQQTATSPAVVAETAVTTPEPEDTPEPAATATVSPTPGPTATATREPTGALTVCMAQEPASLFLYGPDSYAARVVREAIYDGPIDTREYGYQAVILEKVPSLADGDARLETATVGEGDLVVDAAGNVVTLRDGVTVRPAGCFSDECAVSYVSDSPAAGGEEGAEEGEDETAATVEMDQLVVDFQVLEGITWSDGEPLTAEDSVFSFQVAELAEIPPRQRTGQQGVVPARRIDPVVRTASYEATGELAVRWTGLPGYLDSYYQGNFFVPLPEHQLGAMTPEELQQAEASARLPLGWGPYVLSEWVPGEQITANRNEHYFRADEELPYFDAVEFRFAGENGHQLPDALQDGACDVVTNDALGLDWESYSQWAEQGAVQFYHTPGTIWEHVVFGINPSAQVTWRDDLFEDARVRQAAAHCIDRQALMNELMGGYSAVPNAYVPPDHPLYPADELNTYDYDPQAGMALLQEAGWRDTNGDGILEAYGMEGLADGATLVFNFVTTESALRERVGAVVANNLAQCGMSVNVTAEPVPPQVFFTPDINSPIFSRTFDMTGFAWFADMLPPCHLYLSSETPSAATGWSGFNVSGFSNEAYDQACQSARGTVPGMDTFAERHAEAMRIFNEQLPAIPLFVHLKTALARPDIEGLTLDPTQTGDTWNLESLRRSE